MSLDPKPARRLLDEPAAWREIARRHAERVGPRSTFGIYLVADQDLVMRRVEDAMYARRKAAGFPLVGVMRRRDYCLAALFLALEAEDEALP